MSEALAATPPSAARLPPILAYAERKVLRPGVIDRAATRVVGAARARLAGWQGRRHAGIAEAAMARWTELAALSDADLDAVRRTASAELRGRGDFPPELVANAFALIREVSGRVSGQRPYPVQMMGAAAILHGRVAQMATGEGKTLTAGLAAATAALAGLPVHVVTVNAYLAERDAGLMQPLYAALGLSVGVVSDGQELPARAAAHACDITYCTNKDLAFDYLRDRIALGQRASDIRLKLRGLAAEPGVTAPLRLRGLHFAIVDEADSVLIDEARTPLIISASAGSQFDSATLTEALAVAAALAAGQDYVIDLDQRRVVLTEEGRTAIDARLAGAGPAWRARVTREELIRQALSALHLFHRDEHYILRDGKVVIIDEYTGRVMPDRAWSDGLHQMIEHKEGCALSSARTTLARMTYQRFFRRYCRLAGMTGTTAGVEAEFWTVYGLAVARIPTHRPIRRIHRPDRVLPDEETKWAAVIERVTALNRQGLPVLLGTRSVAASDVASARLAAAGLAHTVLSAAQDRQEAEIVARAGERGRITVATNMAGRGTDIKLDPWVAENGGLHVIMTERHDARRIDGQLAGRAGRQGEPGSFEAILSLDDPLLDGLPVPRPLARALLARFGQPAGRLLLRWAQSRAERLHARMRGDLLRADRMQDRILAFAGHSE
ncbi:prepilin peptidase [Methylobacterium currus]|uniref:Protein translocase subunit SecA n=1 Tax=Methylobacterium currus TaxID=2051553 RepID=A0A2R4WJL3_9HYPH|nr:preprotein translocase subunit SecA [Methylobacterium currus]AWB21738.1 prepilin peptidase [Methylobacterium currus]